MKEEEKKMCELLTQRAKTLWIELMNTSEIVDPADRFFKIAVEMYKQGFIGGLGVGKNVGMKEY